MTKELTEEEYEAILDRMHEIVNDADSGDPDAQAEYSSLERELTYPAEAVQ